MKRFYKLLILYTVILATVGLVSCEWIKEYATGEVEDEKPHGYMETRENQLFEYDVYRDHISITSYIGEDIDVKIPSMIDEKPVTTIASLAFFTNNNLESIDLPETLTTIEASAFYYCNMLTRLKIPQTVSFIGERAFAWCSALTDIVLPKTITEIKDYTFNNCSSLSKITIPETVTSIGTRAFSWCSSLTIIEIPTSVKSIGDKAFLNCGLLEYAVVPSSTTKFGVGIFDGCEKIRVVTQVGTHCYAYCTAEENDYPTITEIPAESESNEDESEEISDDKKSA